MTDIPVAKAQLLGRISDFDGGQTAAWLSDLDTRGKAIWRAVRDPHTGHAIHVVSDRSFASPSLRSDLHLGLRLLAWMSTETPVTWYWWDQPWTRHLPANTDPRKEHLNGGWAIPGVPEVHVYRREEAHKVMLHETIHALRLDVPHALVEPVRRQFEDLFGRKLWPHLGEAFTEFYAEWLWCVVPEGTTKASLGTTSKTSKNDRWIHQLQCSEGQAAAVWARIRDATADEDTNVFAYYVLKWVLMQHQNEVLLAPNASVRFWFTWFQELRPRLEAMADKVAWTENTGLAMGMTCLTSDHATAYS